MGKVIRVQGGLQEGKEIPRQTWAKVVQRGRAQERVVFVRGVLCRDVLQDVSGSGADGSRGILEAGHAFTPCQGMWVVLRAAVSPEVGSG